MTSARDQHTATLLNNGLVLIAGGSTSGNGDGISSAELFDPSTNTFSAVGATMTTPRGGHTATRLPDGTVLLAGGDPTDISSGNPTSSAEIYNPSGQTFTAVPSRMNATRSGDEAALLTSGSLNGQVLLMGGFGSQLVSGATLPVLGSVEAYNPATQAFTSLSATMVQPLAGHKAVVLSNGQVVIFGGGSNNTTAPNIAPTTATELFLQ